MSSPMHNKWHASPALRWSLCALTAGVGLGLCLWRIHPWSRELITAKAPSVLPRAIAKTETPRCPSGWLAASADADLLAVVRSKLTDPADVAEAADVLAILARTDPRRALELAAAATADDEARYPLVSAILRQWARHDLGAAWRWAQTAGARHQAPGYDLLAQLLLQQAAKEQPQAIAAVVTAALQSAPAAPAADAQLAHLAIGALLQHGRGELAQALLTHWSRTPQADALDAATYELVAGALAAQSPSAAAAWLQSLPPAPARAQSFANIAAVWADSDPHAAAEWALTLSPKDGRAAALSRSLARWAEQGSEQVARWIVAHEADAGADHMIAQLLNPTGISRPEPRVGAQWADLIRDDALYFQNLASILPDWANCDRPAASAYLNANKRLTREQREQLAQTLALEKTF